MQARRIEGDVATETHRFRCSSCGSDLRFKPGSSLLTCDHCGNEEQIPETRAPIEELDLRAAASLEAVPVSELEETQIARCESCGAQIEFDPDIHAQECPFCASPLVIGTGVHRHIKPQAQLPFLLSEADAQAQMRKWLGRLWFAPSKLKRLARAHRGMNGVYVPYWTYDAETRSSYSGKRGTIYYETRPVRVIRNGRSQTVMQQTARIRWSAVNGRVARDFDDVLVLGSKSLPKRFTDALAPWDLSVLSSYEPKYLAGFRAEGYTVPVDGAYDEAKAIMNGVIQFDVRRDIGGDRQKIDRVKTDVDALTFKHILLPVWLAAYRFRGRTFRFVVNGRTGSVQGERPYSAIKIALAVFVMFLLAAIFAGLQIGQ